MASPMPQGQALGASRVANPEGASGEPQGARRPGSTASGAHGAAPGASGRASAGGAMEDSRFECNICLDQVNEPVVTLCGHLFCWPCLYRWLNTNHNMCPVCKAGVTKDSVIPLYGRGTEQIDPRTKPREQDDVPGRPAAQRPEARPQAQPPGFVGPNVFGNPGFGTHYSAHGMTFSAGFGFFPSLFGLQFQTFTPPPSTTGGPMTTEEAQQAFLSRLLLLLGIFTIGCLLMC